MTSGASGFIHLLNVGIAKSGISGVREGGEFELRGRRGNPPASGSAATRRTGRSARLGYNGGNKVFGTITSQIAPSPGAEVIHASSASLCRAPGASAGPRS